MRGDVVYYLIAIPIAVLLYHSIWIIGKKYIGKEPLWLKVYLWCVLLYVVITPTVFVNYLFDKLKIPGTITTYAMLLTGLLVFFLAITCYPKQTIEKDGFREHQ
ncbi:hypothetical protein JFV29_14175 [Peribacillus sp. TH16]|uniref:hypothetical protein n=1 Tax=Peribacillus sp. TH16 TaxID=2798482 RepID=UPI001912A0E4|nr:hypothetical protein [Peribacillus sp. TH16]MBK5482991.1 hypothetical protein [Peribacillus sp. TH16]MBK5483017.1 hypothetical protein [Peribacillus sp. TH16]